jgi:cell wall-associated NlpC family hydrolase
MTCSIRRLTSWAAMVLTMSVLVVNAAPMVASAAPVDDARAQAAALEAQINDNGVKLDALSEKINTAQVALDAAEAAIRDADTKIATMQAERSDLREEIAHRAVSAYVHHSSSSGVFDIDLQHASELIEYQKYSAVANGHDQQLVNKLSHLEDDLDAKRAQAHVARDSAAAQKQQMEATRADLAAGDAKQRSLLAQVNGQVATLVAQAQAARQADQAKAAQTRYDLVAAPSAPSQTPPQSPSAGVGAVLAYAYAQLGKPYCYAGVGPSCFDCSGLSMMAWAQAGVTMPHSSSDQLAMFPKVSMSQLQPGDLVFWDGHVGIYVGNGSVLHAPHTGTVVQITPIWPGVIGAVRPR